MQDYLLCTQYDLHGISSLLVFDPWYPLPYTDTASVTLHICAVVAWTLTKEKTLKATELAFEML